MGYDIPADHHGSLPAARQKTNCPFCLHNSHSERCTAMISPYDELQTSKEDLRQCLCANVAAAERPKIMVEPELYYIQNKGYAGNCLFWWRPDGRGYTCDLNEAWKVTKERAEEICRTRPKEDIPRLVKIVDGVAVRHVTGGFD